MEAELVSNQESEGDLFPGFIPIPPSNPVFSGLFLCYLLFFDSRIGFVMESETGHVVGGSFRHFFAFSSSPAKRGGRKLCSRPLASQNGSVSSPTRVALQNRSKVTVVTRLGGVFRCGGLFHVVPPIFWSFFAQERPGEASCGVRVAFPASWRSDRRPGGASAPSRCRQRPKTPSRSSILRWRRDQARRRRLR